jgi:catechol 2,3-dioxygenase-like lactoylglutathione lyase family enzyme
MQEGAIAPLVLALNHIQLAMPAGQEAAAEAFYAGVLGFTRVAKPPQLQARGGCWFEANGIHLHLGVEHDFIPARKAHPAFVVTSLQEARRRLEAYGCEIVTDTQLNGYERFYAGDPFGNRLEFMQPVGGSAG